MSILLAPYNDSMRLGMGFNSYTQTMCTDNAVKVTRQDTVRSDNPSQVVTYSSKVVESLSEVVGSMNISYSSSIRKGTVEVAGSTNSINEDKIKQSDLNAVVSVKVVNQTTIINEDCEFQPLPNVVPGSKDFDDAFGDCYISGFIEGGDFNGVISMRVMDRSKVETVSKAIKKSLSSGSGKDFALDMDAFTSDTSHSNALNNTETTVSVSWMGGGQVKDASTKWELSSVFAAAAAFPSQVAKCPQRTWAILTKYKANRSFQAKLSRVLFSPLEYDAVASYTQELFENFMEYKQLMKIVQDMMNNPSSYETQKAKHNGITLDVRTLVAVRTAMRQEMNKIVAAVDVLSRDPNSLKRDANSQTPPTDALVLSIIREALGAETQPQSHSQLVSEPSAAAFEAQSQSFSLQSAPSTTSVIQSAPPAESATQATVPASMAPASATESTIPTTVPDGTASTVPLTESTIPATGSETTAPVAPATENTVPVTGSDATASTTSSAGANVLTPATGSTEISPPQAPATSTTPPAAPIQVSQPREKLKFDYTKLMAPEIWSDLLPVAAKPTSVDAVGATAMPSAISHQWAVAPDGDEAVQQMAKKNAPAIPKLTILAAACGLSDITDSLQSLVSSDQTLKVKGSQFLDFVADAAVANKDNGLMPYSKQVGFVYQYADKPMRLFMVKNPEIVDKDRDVIITPESTDMEVKPSTWNADTWSITAVTWGAKCYSNNPEVMNKIQEQIRSSYNSGNGQRAVLFANNTIGDDPWPNNGKLGMIFYQVKEGGRMHVAVGVENISSAIMTENLGARSLADHLELAKLRQGATQSASQSAAVQAQIQREADQKVQAQVNQMQQHQREAEQKVQGMAQQLEQARKDLSAATSYDLARSGALNGLSDAGIPSGGVNKSGTATVTFNPPLKHAPLVLSGLSKIDIQPSKSGNLKVAYDADYTSVDRNGFNASARILNDCLMWDCGMSWLALPEKDYHAEAGVVNTYLFNIGATQKITRTINFKKPFKDTPKILCWLSDVSMGKQATDYYGINVKVDGGDKNRFNLTIESWSVLNFNNACVGWFAYEASEDNNRIQFLEHSTGNQGADGKAARSAVYPKVRREFNRPFNTKPAVFAAMRKFDCRSNSDGIRLKALITDIDNRGVVLDAGTWADTGLADLQVIVIAIEP